jgi:hypothetical protein
VATIAIKGKRNEEDNDKRKKYDKDYKKDKKYTKKKSYG